MEENRQMTWAAMVGGTSQLTEEEEGSTRMMRDGDGASRIRVGQWPVLCGEGAVSMSER